MTYNRNGYICFRFISKWYAGGVGETREYGLTYRLKDGKKLGVQDVVAGKKSFCMFWARYIPGGGHGLISIELKGKL